MSRVRFHSARSLFETFRELDGKITQPPTDEPPVAFARGLAAAGAFGDAVTFCAFLLPRRESVWWACRSVRAFLGDLPQASAPGLRAAEAWAQGPDEKRREAALRIGAGGEAEDPGTWLARAAGWAGGTLFSNPKTPAPTPPYMTPRACRIAVLLSGRLLRPAERAARLQACVTEAINLAETGL